jgi:hypothetical protein
MENAKSMLTEVSPQDSSGLLTQNGRSLRSVLVFGGSRFDPVTKSFADEVALPASPSVDGEASF